LANFEKRFAADWQLELKSVQEEVSPYAKREGLIGGR
jgi:hypothetical protein